MTFYALINDFARLMITSKKKSKEKYIKKSLNELFYKLWLSQTYF